MSNATSPILYQSSLVLPSVPSTSFPNFISQTRVRKSNHNASGSKGSSPQLTSSLEHSGLGQLFAFKHDPNIPHKWLTLTVLCYEVGELSWLEDRYSFCISTMLVSKVFECPHIISSTYMGFGLILSKKRKGTIVTGRLMMCAILVI